jgi:transcriptional antiterminator RfaH
MEQWHALHTKPNAEYQVATALQRQELEVYLPEIEVPNTSEGRRDKPFFPCYLFLKVDFETVGLSQVQWTPGLRRVLTFGDQLAPVSNKVIDLIQQKLGEIKANGGWPLPTFKPGDTVRINDGPFKDMLAIFEGPTTPSQRVQVLLNILGHISRVQISVVDLEKAPPGVSAPGPKRLRRTRGQGHHIKRTAE